MAKPPLEIGIIGAGPYGLAAAAHLRSAGVNACIFGQPMDFWKKNMPRGMFLRSPVCASHISDPSGSLSLEKFAIEKGMLLSAPIPLDQFVEYGRWFQQKVAPDIDSRRVVWINPSSNGFGLLVDDGETVHVKRVVIATGIIDYARRISQFASLPRELVSHTVEHADLSRFSGKRVVVVGGGQSALESAALLSEAGSEVEVVVRALGINWLGQRFKWLKSPRNPLRPLLYRPSDVGPPGLNLINSMPDVFRKMPHSWRERVAYRSIRPAGAPWLVKRLQSVKISTGCLIDSATVAGDRVLLKFNNGSESHADHILQATGYSIDISRCEFLSPQIIDGIRRTNGYPQLDPGFESSIPGLHFIGATAASSFGPICRFVSGGGYTARALTNKVIGRPYWSWNWT